MANNICLFPLKKQHVFFSGSKNKINAFFKFNFHTLSIKKIEFNL